jgi:hypothetical protein
VVGGRDEVDGDVGGGAAVGGGVEVAGGFAADEGVEAVVVGAPVGFSGNCCVSVGDGCPLAPAVVGATEVAASAITHAAVSARTGLVARARRRVCALSEGHTSAPHPQATLSG